MDITDEVCCITYVITEENNAKRLRFTDHTVRRKLFNNMKGTAVTSKTSTKRTSAVRQNGTTQKRNTLYKKPVSSETLYAVSPGTLLIIKFVIFKVFLTVDMIFCKMKLICFLYTQIMFYFAHLIYFLSLIIKTLAMLRYLPANTVSVIFTIIFLSFNYRVLLNVGAPIYCVNLC